MAKDPAWKRAGFSREYAYRKARQRAQQWSDEHSQRESSRYDKSGIHKTPEAFGDYYRTFVSTNGSLALHERGAHSKARRILELYFDSYGGSYGWDVEEVKARYGKSAFSAN